MLFWFNKLSEEKAKNKLNNNNNINNNSNTNTTTPPPTTPATANTNNNTNTSNPAKRKEEELAPDSETYCTVVECLVRNEQLSKALDLLDGIVKEGDSPNERMFLPILSK